MISKKYDFALIGGDSRQIYMESQLKKEGFSVISYGLNLSSFEDNCISGESLDLVMKSSSNLILPIPYSLDDLYIKSQNKPFDLTIENFLNNLEKNHRVYGGVFNSNLCSYFKKQGIYYLDLMKEEEILLYNSIATAEGAIAEGIKNSNCNLHDSSTLVLGFGKCGKTLGMKLKNLSKNIDIGVRAKKDKILADLFSFGVIDFYDLEKEIDQYDYIFNTIPSLVLTKRILDKTKANVTIIDIASSPGGVDYKYAKKIKRNARLCLGLPGKYSPKSSGVFLSQYILSDLRK